MKAQKTIFSCFFLIFGTLFCAAQEVEMAEKNVIRVLSYNILHGATTNRDGDLDKVAKVINDARPDIVALQEVDYRTKRALKRDIATELALKTNMTSMFGKAMDYNEGEYGQSILSRWTFLRTGKLPLPHGAEKEPRIAVEGIIPIPPGDTIQFIGTHLDHLKESEDRMDQAKEINLLLEENIFPAILAGDLNDVPGSKSISLFESKWTPSYDRENPEPTFPSNAPEVKIDYVMFYPENRWKVVEKRVICDEIASDHCAYLVVLELLPHS